MPADLRIRVLIADDAEDIRLLLRLALEKRGVIDVVGEAADGLEAVSLASQLLPDIVILDISMPNLDGLQAAERIRHTNRSSGIVMYSGFYDEDLATKAQAAGADAYVEKGSDLAMLEETITVVFLKRSTSAVPERVPEIGEPALD